MIKGAGQSCSFSNGTGDPMYLLPQVNAASALAAAHAPTARAALASSGPRSVAFVCATSDELACELVSSYAPHGIRFGNHELDGVQVFALGFEDALRLLAAPNHRGDKSTQIKIALHLRPGHVISIAYGALALRDVTHDCTN